MYTHSQVKFIFSILRRVSFRFANALYIFVLLYFIFARKIRKNFCLHEYSVYPLIFYLLRIILWNVAETKIFEDSVWKRKKNGEKKLKWKRKSCQCTGEISFYQIYHHFLFAFALSLPLPISPSLAFHDNKFFESFHVFVWSHCLISFDYRQCNSLDIRKRYIISTVYYVII